MNAIDLLTTQHRHIEHLFDRFGRLAPDDVVGRQDAIARLADLLANHMAIEEEHLYPRASRFRRPDSQDEAYSEHQDLKEALAEILEIDPGDPAFGDKVAALHSQVEQHFEEEETELFPALEQLLDEAELSELGQVMAERAGEAPTETVVEPDVLLN